jgi:hypothetical protein
MSVSFISLASYGDTEQHLYGGGSDDSYRYLPRPIAKKDWVAQSTSNRCFANPTGYPETEENIQFELENSYSFVIPRSQDYTTAIYLEVSVPVNENWVDNLFHRLIKRAVFHMKTDDTDIIAQQFSPESLDVWAAFTQQQSYYDMINPDEDGRMILPLPFFFSRKPSSAYPSATVPYSGTYLTIEFNTLNELLLTNSDSSIGNDMLIDFRVYTNGVVTNGHHRHKLASHVSPYILATENNEMIVSALNPGMANEIVINSNSSVKTLFFMVREKKNKNRRLKLREKIQIKYTDGSCIANQYPKYFSHIQPHYQPHGVVPRTPGYYMLSFAQDFVDVQPTGSINLGSLNEGNIKIKLCINDILDSVDYEVVIIINTINVLQIQRGCVSSPTDPPKPII